MKWNIKGFFSGCVVTAALFGLIGTATATVGQKTVNVDYNNIKVTLDGNSIDLVDANGASVEPFSIDGTTYLPVRAVSNALGLDVNWDSTTSTVILTTPEDERAVYITRTGEKYHFDSSCNGGTYFEVPMQTALDMGLTPCDKCANSTLSNTTADDTTSYTTVNNNQPFFQTVN